MDSIQIIMLALLGIFYTAYLVKMLILKRHGVTVNLLGKGNKPKKALIIELLLRFTTLAGIVIQFGSVIFPDVVWSFPTILPVRIVGTILLLLGNLIFIVAMYTMQFNWRAGFDRNQNTSLVTDGIYKFSRNPAFVGFDLLYIGCATVFPNIINIITALIALILFHFQISEEERFCAETFGQKYMDYKSKTTRYFGFRKV